MDILQKCIEIDKWEFVENMPEAGHFLNLFVKKVAENPVNKHKAYEVVITSISNI